MKNAWILIFTCISLTTFGQGDSFNFRKVEADQYFEGGRYWDAFFLYRDLAKTPEFQGDYTIESQIKNSSRAMYLWRKVDNYRAFQQYDVAKANLQDILVINPYDPNRGLLPVLTLEIANQMKRRAIASRTDQGAADYLSKALNYYNLALDEGLKDDLVFALIRQVENALEKNPYADKLKQPTTYDINYQKEKAERSRNVEILKEQ